MKAITKKKVTLMMETDVYLALRAKVGSRGMGEYISKLTRPHVVTTSLEASYRELARGQEETTLVHEWDLVDPIIEAENVWRL